MTHPSLTEHLSLTELHPRIGFVNLGCPRTHPHQLRADGYGIAPSYEDADLVVVTCGFIEAAIDDSLCAIDEARHAIDGKVY